MQKQQQNTGSPPSSYTSPGSFHTMVPSSISREGSFKSIPPYQTQDQQTQDQNRRQQQLDKIFEQQFKARIESGRKKRKQVDRKYEQYKARKQLPGNDLFHQTQQEKFLKQFDDIIVTQRQKETKRQLEQKKKQYKNIFGSNYIELTEDSQKNLSDINNTIKTYYETYYPGGIIYINQQGR